MSWKKIRELLGMRTEAEDVEAGRNYVNAEIRKHGKNNTDEMNRLWAECDGAFDYTPYDKGMRAELNANEIPDPQDPRWDH